MSLQSLDVNVIVERAIACIDDSQVEPACIKCDDTGSFYDLISNYFTRCTCSAGRHHA